MISHLNICIYNYIQYFSSTYMYIPPRGTWLCPGGSGLSQRSTSAGRWGRTTPASFSPYSVRTSTPAGERGEEGEWMEERKRSELCHM